MKKELIGIILVFTLVTIVFSGCFEIIEIEETETEEEEKEEEGTGGIHIKTVEGRLNNSSVVDEVYLYIALYGGQGSLDMNEVIIHVTVKSEEHGMRSEDLVYNAEDPETAVGGRNYGSSAVVNPLGAFPDTLDPESILKLTISLGGDSHLPTLPPNTGIEIKIMQAVGGPTAEEEITTPGEYPGAGGIIDLGS
jgi:archaellin